MPTEPRPLRTVLLAALAGCAPAEWPVCGNEEEITAADYTGYGDELPDDFLVCTDLPDDGSACPDYQDVEANALFEEEVGPTSTDDQGMSMRTDCGPELTREDACCYVLAVDGAWISGRPFAVGGRPRVAPVLVGRAWGGASTGGAREGRRAVVTHPRSLGAGVGRAAATRPAIDRASLRAHLAREWAGVARAEHASVASFARFTLDLLALGAPPALLAAAARAQADEVVHAQLAFALAAAYAGAPVAPGRLAVGGGTAAEPDPAAVAAALAREGCVGETVAAALATVALREAHVPAVRRALRRIAADEARHAALAWRAARWLLAEFPEARVAFDGAFDAAVSELVAGSSDPAPPRDSARAAALRAHGVLPAADARRATADALRTVVMTVRAAL